MTSFSSHAALDAASRTRKAAKIDRLLAECARVEMNGRLLEVGAGSGLISGYFAGRYKGRLRVSAVDVTDQRVERAGFDFQLYDGRVLPYRDGEFDFVVSNHVIEHVGAREAQRLHLREMARVLSPGGVIYVATPSKWQLVEPHFGLPGLSWVPRSIRDGYVRLAGKGTRYDCDPMGHRELERMAGSAGLQSRNINAKAFLALDDQVGGPLSRWLTRIPERWLSLAYRASPTMVYLLRHRAAGI